MLGGVECPSYRGQFTRSVTSTSKLSALSPFFPTWSFYSYSRLTSWWLGGFFLQRGSSPSILVSLRCKTTISLVSHFLSFCVPFFSLFRSFCLLLHYLVRYVVLLLLYRGETNMPVNTIWSGPYPSSILSRVRGQCCCCRIWNLGSLVVLLCVKFAGILVCYNEAVR